MQLESSGLPTVTITSDVFATLGSSVAERLGMPDLPFVIVPHPVAHRSVAAVEQLADDVLSDIVRALTAGDAGD